MTFWICRPWDCRCNVLALLSGKGFLMKISSPKLTAKAPENGWNTIVSFWEGLIFNGELFVSGSVLVVMVPIM